MEEKKDSKKGDSVSPVDIMDLKFQHSKYIEQKKQILKEMQSLENKLLFYGDVEAYSEEEFKDMRYVVPKGKI